ncbi:MAG: hypothetical protein N3B18_00640 [Desulfobacterota bacterium]|nr:hypothetical protein [Thermodesulfobacteriota bacterium]
MSKTSLPETCFELLSREIPLKKRQGHEDIEKLYLLSGEDGGGITLYTGEKIARVALVSFRFGNGVPIPHHENRLAIGAEIFQIMPDFSYKLPVWGINSVIMKDGTYYFDTDLSFGVDLVREYDFVMKYLEPFDVAYKKFNRNPDLKIVAFGELTTWVRTYISPVFFTAVTTVDRIKTVYDLAAAYISLWVHMYRDAADPHPDLKQAQQERLHLQYAGMKHTDRMGKVLQEAFGQETFAKFFKAMASS